MRYRLYLPTDNERLTTLYQEMGLAEETELPLAGQDPCFLLGVVGENGNGKPDVGVMFRLTAEAVLVVNPLLKDQATPVLGLVNPARVALQLRDKDLRDLKLGGITDVHAFVPAAKPRMLEFVETLGFKPCFEDFRAYYRKVGD